jgi:hypothetical protein
MQGVSLPAFSDAKLRGDKQSGTRPHFETQRVCSIYGSFKSSHEAPDACTTGELARTDLTIRCGPGPRSKRMKPNSVFFLSRLFVVLSSELRE